MKPLALFFVIFLISMPGFAQQPGLNGRALTCEPIEFAELNSLDFDELEQMYCSAFIGGKAAMDRAAAVPASDVYATSQANRMALAFSDRCMRIMRPAGDIAAIKFKDKRFACAKYEAASQK